MYTLNFTSPADFELLYEALCVSNGFSGGELRLVNSLFTKMEYISILKTGPDGLKGLRTLDIENQPSQGLMLENAEFELLKNAFNKVSWTSQGARLAFKVYEYLQNLQSSS